MLLNIRQYVLNTPIFILFPATNFLDVFLLPSSPPRVVKDRGRFGMNDMFASYSPASKSKS